LGIAQWKSQRN